MQVRFHIAAMAAAVLLFANVSMAQEAPPTARKVDVVDHDFGLTMPDPYRWMEGEGNAEFNTWLKAHGEAGRARLDALPTLESWQKRLAAANGAMTSHSDATLVGKRLFFMRAQAGKEAVLMVREENGDERALFDPNMMKGSPSIGSFNVSPDGSKVTVGVGYSGNEIGELQIIDATSGKHLADTLKPAWRAFGTSWLPDGSGFFYSRMHDVKPNDADPTQGMSAYLHRIGQPQSADTFYAKGGTDDVLKIASNEVPFIAVSSASPWAILIIARTGAESRACIAPQADVIAGHAAWRCFFDFADSVQNLDVHGDTLYLLSAKNASHRQVLALDLRNPKATLADAKVVVPERTDAVLTNFGVARDGLYLESMYGGIGRLERVDYASGTLTPVKTPTQGAIYLGNTNPRQNGALFTLSAWTAPKKIYRFDGTALVDIGLSTSGAPEYPDVIAEETQATSADGTQVPMSVIYRKDLKKDGHARAIVSGYGGYGSSSSPSFNPIPLEWSQAGNVYAICHVRGGGENGDEWRTGGTGPNKQRGIEDFIACAQELAKRGYSTPSRTAGFGGSMGGILTGGAMTTAPETWGAMAVQSGMFSAVRLLAAKNGANQIPEMGDPRTEAGMKQLLAMDPYQHVRNGVKYPPLLLITGTVDTRVAPWNSGKFGARVMAASPTTPVWFRADDQMGHFTTNANALALEYADIYAFFDAQLH